MQKNSYQRPWRKVFDKRIKLRLISDLKYYNAFIPKHIAVFISTATIRFN